MSLINDALKKAQQQRSQDATVSPLRTPPTTPPIETPAPVRSQPQAEPSPARNQSQPPIEPPPAAVAGPLPPVEAPPQSAGASRPPPPAASATKPPSAVRYGSSAARYTATVPSTRTPSQPNYLKLGIGAFALIAVSVGITVAVMHREAEPDVTPPARPIAVTPPAAPKPVIPVSQPSTNTVSLPSTAPAKPPAPQPSAPAESKPAASSPAVVSVATEAATPTVSLPAAPTAPLPSIYAPRAPTAVNPTVRVQNFIDRLRVAGVRFSSSGNKVILNDRLFLVGEIIDPGLGLRLMKIEEGELTFADAQGRTYRKLFQ